MLEPYVLKGTRTVLRRGETSNCLFLFDVIPTKHKKKQMIIQYQENIEKKIIHSRKKSIPT